MAQTFRTPVQNRIPAPRTASAPRTATTPHTATQPAPAQNRPAATAQARPARRTHSIPHISSDNTQLIGFIGKPELRWTPDGTGVGRFGLAINTSWYYVDEQGNPSEFLTNEQGDLLFEQNGQPIPVTYEKVKWYNCSLFGPRAERMIEILEPGQLLMVEGQISEARIWTDNDGNARTSLDMRIQNYRILRAAPVRSNQQNRYGQPVQSQPVQGTQSQPQGRRQEEMIEGTDMGTLPIVGEEDIPF